MDKGIVKRNELNKCEAFGKMMSIADNLGRQVPQALSASVESSGAFVESKKSEIVMIDAQLKNAKTPEEKQLLWHRRDAACEAIDRKDVQNKEYGLRIVGKLGFYVTVLAGGAIWLGRKDA